MSLSMRRSAVCLVVSSALALLAGCKDKKTPVVVDAAPPTPVATESAAPQVLVPMGEEDAGVDAGVDAGHKPTGPAVNPNVARLKQCCTQLGAQAKSLGASPEAGMLTAAAAQCNALAAQVGPGGTAPELGTIRTLLAGKTIPAACAGF